MKTEEIIEMAMKYGCPKVNAFANFDILQEFTKLVAAKEREACAMVAQKTVCDTHIPTGVRIYGTAAAKAIRARGEA